MSTKGHTPSKLIAAIRAGRLSGVINALDDGADIEEPDMHGNGGLPLRTACFEGNLPIVRELLIRGANPNSAASDGPGAPLRLALRHSHNEIAALLLQNGGELPDIPAIDPDILNIACEPLPGEAVVPMLPAYQPDNIIEFTRSEINTPAIASEDPSATFGTETNALSMDLLFLEEHEALPPLELHPKDSA